VRTTKWHSQLKLHKRTSKMCISTMKISSAALSELLN
jgi:hypothetical protein